MKDDQYRCAACGGVFNKGRSDAVAKAEALANGYNPEEDCVLVCDDCYWSRFASRVNRNGAATMAPETAERLTARVDDLPIGEVTEVDFTPVDDGRGLFAGGAVASNGSMNMNGRWSSKTADDILTDFNAMLELTWTNFVNELDTVIKEGAASRYPTIPYPLLYQPPGRLLIPYETGVDLVRFLTRTRTAQLYRQRRLKPRRHRGKRMP